MKLELLIATSNRGKFREIKDLFGDAPVRLRSLLDFPLVEEVPETGSSFEENAGLKASGYAKQTGLQALADDSGLEIAALGNAPGVLSARYGGGDTGFDKKMSMLLKEMEQSEHEPRDARFVCAMALADASGEILTTSEGICSGTIAPHPRGTGGFGYDPIFVPNGYEATFGELPDEVKREISHRALASRTIIRYLLDFMAV